MTFQKSFFFAHFQEINENNFKKVHFIKWIKNLLNSDYFLERNREIIVEDISSNNHFIS
jgi:hypothetical protein